MKKKVLIRFMLESGRAIAPFTPGSDGPAVLDLTQPMFAVWALHTVYHREH